MPEQIDTGIAIIGLAGRFPGAQTVAEFWRNLCNGVESISFASDEELAVAGIPPELFANPNYVRAGGFLKGTDQFDASFFGYSAREAEVMDPQQRVFLECAWEAFEDAGHDPGSFPGAVGVFAGAGMNTYGAVNLFSNPDVVRSVGPYQLMLANDKDFLSTRVAYKLNLHGPAISVQTACSTSLVAVHLAVESLLRRESDMALAGGVSIAFPQSAGYLYVPGMILSRDGHCRAFDAGAGGTVPGAGAGIVVLRRLADALADSDHIYAVIRGSAINNDGSTKVGYTAPSVEGQARVIRQALEDAGFDPESISYVEAHGTGTEVGDPIEITGLTQAFRTERTGFCALGAVKTNIGHLDTAAGVVGLIKAALSIENRKIPGTLHFQRPNPYLDLHRTPFYINTTLQEIGATKPFRAGVSSFGIGGTNSHVCLEEAPPVDHVPQQGCQLIVLSAKTPAALNARASDLLKYLGEHPSTNLADLAFTLQVGRKAFSHRRAMVCRDPLQLEEALQSANALRVRHGVVETENPPVAFLFPGQGSQYVNMGHGVYKTNRIFREAIDQCSELLQSHLGFDLRSILYPQPGKEAEAEHLLNQTRITQPALFVVEYAMATLWSRCGIRPAAMVGHSVGEYVAACLANVFSLEDALALISARGMLIQSMSVGSMLAVNYPVDQINSLLGPELSVAAVNAPTQMVVSGPPPVIEELETVLKSRKIECKRLRTSHAFHSAMLDPIIADFVNRVQSVRRSAPTVPYLSNLTGTWITNEQATDPQYWGRHLRHCVRFADCIRELIARNSYVLLEVGPGETLLSLTRPQLGRDSAALLVSSMRHPLAKQEDWDHWLDSLGRLWTRGLTPEWNVLHNGYRRRRVALPTYPFERQRFWIEPKKEPRVVDEVQTLAKNLDIASWFYLPSWKRCVRGPVPPNKTAIADTTLVFIHGNDSFASHLAARLRLKSPTLQVGTGTKFERLPDESYRIDPQNPQDYRSLLQELSAHGKHPSRIVHAWSLNSTPELAGNRTLDLGFISLMFLMQAIGELGSGTAIEVNVAISGAYSVLNEPISNARARILVGLCNVIPLEYPNVKSRVVDVDPNIDGETRASQLVDEIFSELAGEIVVCRRGVPWLPQYEPVRFEAGIPPKIRIVPNGVYLITGGLGGIGLVFAQYLARTAKARVVLTSRNPFPDPSGWQNLLQSEHAPKRLKERINGAQRIIELGGDVLILEADSANQEQMRRAVSRAEDHFGPVRGIIHAAGTPGGGMLQLKSAENASSVLSAKVQGSLWIEEHLNKPALDFVLLCSSINCVLPTFGSADYTAANCYLDAFAATFDNEKGTRVISVNWDTWRDVGMIADAELPANLAHAREEALRQAISSEEASTVLERIFSNPVPQIIISTRDLHARLRRARSSSAWVNRSAAPVITTENANSRREPTAAPLASVPNDNTQLAVLEIWQDLLGTKQISSQDNFFELGGHSLLGTQVLARIRDRFGIDMPLRMVFEAPTPTEMAERISKTLGLVSPSVSSVLELEREEIEI